MATVGALRIDVFTIFPDLVDRFCTESLLGRARAAGRLDLRCHDLRDHTTDVHRTVDDAPFGGGAGMVLRPEPVFAAVEAAAPPRPLYLLGPGGRRFDQALARELAAGDGFSLLCGRYEGVDDRVRAHLVDGELSIGDYVLGGGEVAACVVIEAVTRLRPGVMGNEASVEEESFGADGLLEGAPVDPAGHVPRLGRCPRSCARATTAASPAGATPRPCTARCACARTSSRPAAGSPTEEVALLESTPEATYPGSSPVDGQEHCAP